MARTSSSGELRANIRAIASSEPGSVSKITLRAAAAECDSAAIKAKQSTEEIKGLRVRRTLCLNCFRGNLPGDYESRLNLFPRWPSVKAKSRLRAGRRGGLRLLWLGGAEYIFLSVCRKMTQREACCHCLSFSHTIRRCNSTESLYVSRLRPESRSRARPDTA